MKVTDNLGVIPSLKGYKIVNMRKEWLKYERTWNSTWEKFYPIIHNHSASEEERLKAGELLWKEIEKARTEFDESKKRRTRGVSWGRIDTGEHHLVCPWCDNGYGC